MFFIAVLTSGVNAALVGVEDNSMEQVPDSPALFQSTEITPASLTPAVDMCAENVIRADCVVRCAHSIPEPTTTTLTVVSGVAALLFRTRRRGSEIEVP